MTEESSQDSHHKGGFNPKVTHTCSYLYPNATKGQAEFVVYDENTSRISDVKFLQCKLN